MQWSKWEVKLDTGYIVVGINWHVIANWFHNQWYNLFSFELDPQILIPGQGDSEDEA